MLGTSQQAPNISKTGFTKIWHTAVSKPNRLGFQVKKLVVTNLKVGKKIFHILSWAFFTRTTLYWHSYAKAIVHVPYI